MGISRRRHGSQLHASFDEHVVAHDEQASARLVDINERLAELETEQADLRRLKRKIEAVKAVK